MLILIEITYWEINLARGLLWDGRV